MNLTRDQANVYGPEGLFDPLDDLLNRFGPDITPLLTPDYIAMLRSPTDGKIYFLPKYYPVNLSTEFCFNYRLDILQALGLPEPVTVNDWLSVLRRVKQAYPNMIPLTLRNRDSIWWSTTPAWDMGRMDGLYGILPSEFDKHEIVYLPITQQWRDMLTYFNTLYSEGLLDPEYLTHQYDDWWERKLGGGRAFAEWSGNAGRADGTTDNNRLAGITTAQWMTADYPQNYKTGIRSQYKTVNPWENRGAALNSKSSAAVKEAAVRFMNFFFSDAGDALGQYGNWRYPTDPTFSRNYLDGKTWRDFATEQEWAQFYGHQNASAAGTFELPFLSRTRVEDPDPTRLANFTHYSRDQHIVPIPTLNRSGNLDRWVTVTTDIQTYVRTAMDEFVVGRRPLSQWDAYVAEVRRLGIDANVAVVQSWYDEYWRLRR
jgi:putative aldouronate transport system substrate-binding protein